jgi:hypothetical protein
MSGAGSGKDWTLHEGANKTRATSSSTSSLSAVPQSHDAVAVGCDETFTIGAEVDAPNEPIPGDEKLQKFISGMRAPNTDGTVRPAGEEPESVRTEGQTFGGSKMALECAHQTTIAGVQEADAPIIVAIS